MTEVVGIFVYRRLFLFEMDFTFSGFVVYSGKPLQLKSRKEIIGDGG